MTPSIIASEISSSQYATRRKELLSLVKQLRSIGAQADLDLPRITVIGNQSAGKSSVVEAISGITVPRDAGTCTRCPMECRLSSTSGPWSCQVSIRWEFDENDKPLDEVSEVPFGSLITDKNKVELALRQAQAAVLNPSISTSSFLTSSLDDLKNVVRGPKRPLLFSRNAVCVDLEGPELTDLSFIDLPGIIQNAEPEIVKLVEDLVISHIRGNCLILVALPMTDDIENQKALRLAHQVDSEGRRTIGVITKPDMLTAGSTKARDLWLDVIEGRRHSLTHGYYCTRQPDDAERTDGINSVDARVMEADFFKKTLPWSNSVHKHRFGMNNLVTTLSALLVQIIKDTLPNLRAETMTCLGSLDEELATLPKPINTEPATYMLNLITSFVHDIERFVQGGPASGDLIHENREAFGKFKNAIRRTAPNFVPYPNSTQKSSYFENFLGEGEDEGPAEGLLSNKQPFSLADMRKHIQKSITRELPDNVPFQAKVALITSFQDTWESSVHECFNTVRVSMLQVLFECIKDKFGRHKILESHIRAYISDLVNRHYTKCLQFLDAILEAEQEPFTQNHHYFESCKDKWLAKYKDARAGRVESPPEPTAKRARPTDSEPAPAPNRSATQSQQNTELSGGFNFGGSSNTFAFGKPATPTVLSRSKNNTGHSLQSGLSGDPSSLASSTIFASGATTSSATASDDAAKINSILGLLADIGYPGLHAADLGKLNPTDEYETELHVMAEVRGYFQVSYKRVIDNIPALIDLKFVKAITKELQNFLISELGLGTAHAGDRCANYLAEDVNVVARRDELVARKNRLEGVKVELQNFGL